MGIIEQHNGVLVLLQQLYKSSLITGPVDVVITLITKQAFQRIARQFLVVCDNILSHESHLDLIKCL